AYDTEYAMIDRADDLKIGIKSSAITFGRFDVLAVMLCYMVTILLLITAGQQLALGYGFYGGLVAAAVVAIHHYGLIKGREKSQCFKAFLHNNWFGFAVFAGLAVHYLMQYQQ
ncbi:MAG TPA: UbiA family prenyltransferase, partial [Methylophilaceae bacterium]|nr:UbiA family prenyltransferase [Methylophilaceae bacterium]